MDAQHNIPMGLRSAYRLMHRQTDARLASLGVTADQFVLLALLSEEDGLTQQELSRRASSDPNTTRAMLLLLEERRLIRRSSHPNDRRAYSVTLTERGVRQFKLLSEAVHHLREHLAALFSEEELLLFLDFLERISNLMREEESTLCRQVEVAGQSL